VKRRRLGRSGPEISVIGVGAWAAGGDEWGGQNRKDSIDAIHQAIACGVNWVDTAPTYGLGFSEELVGRAIAQLPSSERPMVFTKCSRVWGEDGAVRSDLSPASLRRECEASLTRLGLDQIDLYQIHQPAPEPDLEQGWEALLGLQEEGKVRHLGVSNFTVGQLERLRSIAAPVSLQPSYSLIDRNVEEALLPYCRSNGVGVIVWSPLMRGLLAGRLTREAIAALPADDSRRTEVEFREPRLSSNLALVERVRGVARRHGRTPAQIAIAWTLRDPVVTGAIVGMRSAAHAETIAVASTIALDADDLNKLSGAGSS
jgi:aryl-alcohol dehydrogenase-like predicted oxidoreductase